MVIARLLADIVVMVHAAFAVFVVLAWPAVVLGAWRGWQWVRNFWFRFVHLGAILMVAAEALLGIPCPLTTLEKSLRVRAGESTYPGSFLGNAAHRFLFFEVPTWLQDFLHVAFGGVVLLTFVVVPPRWPWAAEPALQD